MMKPTIYLFVWAICLPLVCQAQKWGEKINTLRAQLTPHVTHAVYDSLHFIITEHYLQVTAEERSKIRDSLKKHAHWSTEKLCTDTEKGEKIIISGRVVDEQNKPIPTVQLAIFQADNNGYYAPSDSVSKKMSENDPRLFGFITTDKSGNYLFQTIRPASYPIQYNGRTIPQHIHINTNAVGYNARAIQMVFERDPAMNESYWQDWARKQNYPVVRLTIGKDKRLFGAYDLVLTRVGQGK
ncbi:hypothetical protein EXU85_14575 [Spirosoma sp. KCTC 42546]|uniref:dioxygenase family protein n=1 Tax=Spirosoma sp. KCTC 42546 TaxID=2520506 RepID=UPI001158C001|nr:hypothetical protein [Spirosoma sp. KCTC 42546]QDK79768.1 hypothetical protein EXU85_14575 [Spirosoma sp. KCTC 42546]